MIRTIPLALALSFFAACSYVKGGQVAGSGTTTTDTRSIAAFTAVEASGAFELQVTSGAPSSSVVVEGDDNLVPLFESSVSGDVLRLSMKPGSYAPKATMRVQVSAPRVERVDVSGAIRTEVGGIAGARFEADLTGACTLTARGASETFRLEAQGASEVHAYDLRCDAIDVNLAGASKVHVHAEKSLDVQAAGASKVRYHGSPKVKTSASGASSVEPG